MSLRIAIHGADGKLGRLIVEECGDLFVGAVPKEGAIPNCDVVIDVSSDSGTRSLLSRLSGQKLLVGTTGNLPLKQLESYGEKAAVAIVPNFSLGIPILLNILDQIIPKLPPEWDIEIVETHHKHKIDAPSGTAKRLSAAIQMNRAKEVPIHSLRTGDVFGDHSIYLCGPGERIELSHSATNRNVFAIGALRWAKRLETLPVGLHRA